VFYVYTPVWGPSSSRPAGAHAIHPIFIEYLCIDSSGVGGAPSGVGRGSRSPTGGSNQATAEKKDLRQT